MIGELGEAIAAVDVFADVWAIRVRLQLERATSLCSISPSIASSEGATSCGCKSTTSAPATGCETAPPSFRRRRRPPARNYRADAGLDPRLACQGRARKGRYLFRGVSGLSSTCRRASMRGPSMPGSRAPGLNAPPTARIRCVGQRRRRSTRRWQPASRPTAPRAHEARKHGPLSRHRGR